MQIGDNVSKSNLPRILAPYWYLIIAAILLALSFSFSYWWLIGAIPLGIQGAISWRFYYGTPWKRLYFPLKRCLYFELGMEKGLADKQGRSLDSKTPVLRMVSRYRPHWTEDKIQEFAIEQENRYRAFVDEEPLMAEVKRQAPNLSPQKIKEGIEQLRENFSNYDPSEFHVVIMAGIIETELGPQQRAAFLLEFIERGLK